MGSVQAGAEPQQMEEMAQKLAVLRDELRSAIGRVGDRQAKAVLETGAEVLGGLRQAFVDYAAGDEDAWQR